MADFDLKSSRSETIRVLKLDYPSLAVIGEVDGVESGGSIERSLNTTVKQTCSLTVVDGSIQAGDVIRIVCDMDNGVQKATYTLGTFIATTDNATWDKGASESDIDGYSLLKIADRANYQEPYNVSTGDNLFTHITRILASVGLTPAYVPTEVHTASGNHCYVPEKYSKLDIVNDLLSNMNYLGADTDRNGYVVFRESKSTPAVASTVFQACKDSVMVEKMKVERDWWDSANVVICYVSGSNDTVMRAVAINDSPLSQTSTVSRGTVCRVESVSDIDTQEALQAKALSLLEEETSLLEAVNITHAYQDIDLYDDVKVISGDVDGTYTVQSMKIDLDSGLMTDTRARRYVSW